MTPVAAALLAVVLASAAGAADHRDAPLVSVRRDLDITDVYAFISPSNSQALTLVLTVDPLLAPGTSGPFNSKGTYQLLIDTDGNAKPNAVFNFRFKKPDAEGQQAVKVAATGLGGRFRARGTTEQTIQLPRSGLLFTGLRDDPFFFDQTNSRNGFTFCGPDAADTFAGTNVGAIVVEIPANLLRSNTIGVWGATRRGTRQLDRLGLPLVNELVIGLADKDRYNKLPPARDERVFGTNVAAGLGRLGNDPTTAAALADVIQPDVLSFSLDLPTAFPNGRRLEDDVVDVTLAQLRGATPTDCVDANDMAFQNTFPYLGQPHVPGGTATTTTTTLPGGAVLALGYLHLQPGLSIVCGSVTTAPALPGANASAGVTGPSGPATTDFTLDGSGAGIFNVPIDTFTTYPVAVTIQTGGAPIVLNDSIVVGPAQGTCPGPTGRAVVLGAIAAPPFSAGNVICLDRTSAAQGACVAVGMECLSPGDQRPHKHGTMVVLGTPGGTFPDPSPGGCGHGLVVSGFPGCEVDTIPDCP
jgi:hypothetical protein